MHRPYAEEWCPDDDVMDDIPEAGLAETGEYRITNWDDSEEVVTAYMECGGIIVVAYSDGVTQSMKDIHFWNCLNPIEV